MTLDYATRKAVAAHVARAAARNVRPITPPPPPPKPTHKWQTEDEFVNVRKILTWWVCQHCNARQPYFNSSPTGGKPPSDGCPGAKT